VRLRRGDESRGVRIVREDRRPERRRAGCAVPELSEGRDAVRAGLDVRRAGLGHVLPDRRERGPLSPPADGRVVHESRGDGVRGRVRRMLRRVREHRLRDHEQHDLQHHELHVQHGTAVRRCRRAADLRRIVSERLRMPAGSDHPKRRVDTFLWMCGRLGRVRTAQQRL
jgi:hypothetical protein